MNQDDLKAASDRLAAAYHATCDLVADTKSTEDDARRALDAAHEASIIALRLSQEAKINSLRASHLAAGKCAKMIGRGETWHRTQEPCARNAKSNCPKCGGPYCGTHLKEFGHSFQDWRNNERLLLGSAEKEVTV